MSGRSLAGRGPVRSVRTRELRRPSVSAVSSQVKINLGVRVNTAGESGGAGTDALPLGDGVLDLGFALDQDLTDAMAIDAAFPGSALGPVAGQEEAW